MIILAIFLTITPPKLLIVSKIVVYLMKAVTNYFADSEQFLGCLVLNAMAGQMYKPSILTRMAAPFKNTEI